MKNLKRKVLMLVDLFFMSYFGLSMFATLDGVEISRVTIVIGLLVSMFSFTVLLVSDFFKLKENK